MNEKEIMQNELIEIKLRKRQLVLLGRSTEEVDIKIKEIESKIEALESIIK